MGSKLKNVFLYAGVDESQYKMVESNIIYVNRITLRAFSALATVLILLKYLFSIFTGDLGMTKSAYEIGTLGSLFIFIVSMGPVKKYKYLVMPLVYLSYSVYYIYGMLLGTLCDPSQKAVLFMAMLVFLPVIFVGRPIQSIFLTVIHVGIFIHLCCLFETGKVLSGDISNALILGFVGIAGGTSSACFKVKGYLGRRLLKDANERLKSLSRNDALTGMKNRNAYEADFYKVANACESSLACIFIDVNGLKHINDTEGHDKGDEMLKTVADEIKKHFGDDFAYRIGGDEFVVFVPDPEDGEIKTKTDDILAKIQVKSYYAAIGWKIHDVEEDLPMEDLVKDAETFMYKKKVEFYKQSKFDRRTN